MCGFSAAIFRPRPPVPVDRNLSNDRAGRMTLAGRSKRNRLSPLGAAIASAGQRASAPCGQPKVIGVTWRRTFGAVAGSSPRPAHAIAFRGESAMWASGESACSQPQVIVAAFLVAAASCSRPPPLWRRLAFLAPAAVARRLASNRGPPRRKIREWAERELIYFPTNPLSFGHARIRRNCSKHGPGGWVLPLG